MPENEVRPVSVPKSAEGAKGPSTPAKPRRRLGVVLVALAILLGLLYGLKERLATRSASKAAAGPPAVRPVPVTAAAVARRDVPIYLEGLGNVVAFKTVTVKTLVDGRLDEVLFKEGQFVKKGQVLAQVDPRPYQIQLEQGQGALARDEAQLKNARLTVERDRQLLPGKLIAQQQLDTDVAAAGQLEGAVLVDEATIAAAKLNLDYARIASPIEGVTGIRQVDPGNIVHASDATGIVLLTQLDPIAILFTLPQDDLTPVAEEMARGPLSVEVYSRDGSTQLGSGQLALIDNQINQTTSTIRLKAIAANPRRLLWPNQFVNVRLRLSVRKDAVVMPSTALQRGPNGSFVFVIGADSTVEPRPVQLDLTQGDTAIVASGVRAGERVVVDGQNQLKAGSKVVAREPAKVAANGKPPGDQAAPGGAAGPAPAGAGATR